MIVCNVIASKYVIAAMDLENTHLLSYNGKKLGQRRRKVEFTKEKWLEMDDAYRSVVHFYIGHFRVSGFIVCDAS